MSTTIGPNIIESGLLLCVDASDQNSYQSGTPLLNLVSNNFNYFVFSSTPPIFTGNPNTGNQKITTYITGSNTNLTGACLIGTNLTSTLTGLLYSNHTIEMAINPRNFLYSSTLTGSLTNEVAAGLVIWPGFHSGLYIESSSTLIYNIYNGSISTTGTSCQISQYQNQNIIISATRNNNTMSLYINGQLINVGSGSTAIFPYSSITLGAALNQSPSNNSFEWASNIDIYYLKLYNISLSQTQIIQNYNAMKSRFGLI